MRYGARRARGTRAARAWRGRGAVTVVQDGLGRRAAGRVQLGLLTRPGERLQPQCARSAATGASRRGYTRGAELPDAARRHRPGAAGVRPAPMDSLSMPPVP